MLPHQPLGLGAIGNSGEPRRQPFVPKQVRTSRGGCDWHGQPRVSPRRHRSGTRPAAARLTMAGQEPATHTGKPAVAGKSRRGSRSVSAAAPKWRPTCRPQPASNVMSPAVCGSVPGAATAVAISCKTWRRLTAFMMSTHSNTCFHLTCSRISSGRGWQMP